MIKIVQIKNDYVNFGNVARMVIPEKSNIIRLYFNFYRDGKRPEGDFVMYTFVDKTERDSEVQRILKELSE